MREPNRSSVCRLARSFGGTVDVILDTRETEEAGLGHVDLVIDAPDGKVWKACEFHSLTVSYDRVPKGMVGDAAASWQRVIDDSWSCAMADVRDGVIDCPDGAACETCADRRAEAVSQ